MKKICLIEPKSADYHIFSRFKLPRLGLPLLGETLKKKGYDVTIYNQENRELDYLDICDADLAGISITTSTAPEGYRIARLLKTLSGGRLPIVFGGVHATFKPGEALEHGDYVLCGEADEVFPGIIDGLCSGEIKSGAIHTELVKDLDALPFPDFGLIKDFSPDIIPIQTSRGCPYNCTFCSVTPMFGKQYRTFSIGYVLEMLSRYGNRFVFFYDDNFTHD